VAADSDSAGEVLRFGEEGIAQPTRGAPEAKPLPRWPRVARGRANLSAPPDARRRYSSRDPQAPAFDLSPVGPPENRCTAQP
jgi:hypothetical protein